MKPVKTMIIHSAGLIEVVISNTQPVITNGFIITDYVFKIGSKGLDDIMVPFVNIFQCLGVCSER